VNRLPYAPPTIYNAVHQLEKMDRIKVEKGVVMLVENYKAQKLSEIYVQSLSHGIDPEVLTRESTLSVWKSLDKCSTVKDLVKKTSYSTVYVKKILSFLHEKSLVLYIKRKPIIAEHNQAHPLNRLLRDYLASSMERKVTRYPGSIPFREIMETPDQVEKILYGLVQDSISVKNTGFLVLGDSEKVTIVESVEKELTYEEAFLRKLYTTEGVEDICILMVKQKLLDYGKLLELAKEKEQTNIVGCYLDILHDIDNTLVPLSVIKSFDREKCKKNKVFLAQEKEYGKSGWEAKYEKHWNFDLYLELGAIEQGVRGL